MPLWLERLYPALGALTVGMVYAAFFRTHTFPPALHDLFTAVISVGAIAIGFLATAQTILISLSDRPVVQKLRETGYYKWVVAYIIESIHWSFGAAALSAVGLLLRFAKEGTDQDSLHAAFLIVWWCALAGAALSYFRVVRVLTKVLWKASSA